MRRLLSYSFVLLCLAGIAAPASAQTKPNVVLIVMDDVGYGDYGAYGAPDIRTVAAITARYGVTIEPPAT